MSEPLDGFEYDGGWYVVDDEIVDDWIRPFIDHEGFINESEEFWNAARNQESSGGGRLVVETWDCVNAWGCCAEAELESERLTSGKKVARVDTVKAKGSLAMKLQSLNGE